MIKPDFIEKLLDCSSLHIGATRRDFPIAMRMCPRVAHDDPTKSLPPCLRGAPSLANETGDEELFEVCGSHYTQVAAAGQQTSALAFLNE